VSEVAEPVKAASADPKPGVKTASDLIMGSTQLEVLFRAAKGVSRNPDSHWKSLLVLTLTLSKLKLEKEKESSLG
jgi:hypothetical protein